MYRVQRLWPLVVLCAPLLALAEPISTNQYGFLREGMSQRDVVHRVGEPDSKKVIESGSRGIRTPTGTLLRDYVVEVWVYDGGGNLQDTYLKFENGTLVDKEKVSSGGGRR